MKRTLRIIGVIMLMAVTFLLLTNLFIYIANRPIANPAAVNVKVEEEESVKHFISKTHESLNGFLNYGKSDRYTEGDWKYMKQWFQSQESELREFDKRVKNEKLKRDVKRSYELMKNGIETNNMQNVIYGHRIYHDLDIIINNYQKEQNIWGVSEFGNGANIKVVEDEIVKLNKNV